MADPLTPLIKTNSSLLSLFSANGDARPSPNTAEGRYAWSISLFTAKTGASEEIKPRVCLLFHLCCLLCLSCLLDRRHFLWILPPSELGRVLLTHFNWQEVETQTWKLQSERRKEGRKEGRHPSSYIPQCVVQCKYFYSTTHHKDFWDHQPHQPLLTMRSNIHPLCRHLCVRLTPPPTPTSSSCHFCFSDSHSGFCGSSCVPLSVIQHVCSSVRASVFDEGGRPGRREAGSKRTPGLSQAAEENDVMPPDVLESLDITASRPSCCH